MSASPTGNLVRHFVSDSFLIALRCKSDAQVSQTVLFLCLLRFVDSIFSAQVSQTVILA